MEEALEDKKLICMDCSQSFMWTVGEQEFIQSLYDQGKIREIISPKRCVPCRRKRKIERGFVDAGTYVD